jgi:REP element-mobilizing transposase RayT
VPPHPPRPLYTPQTCQPAYQLNWSLTLFWKDPQISADWLEPLAEATEPDGVRVLEHRFADDRVSQFLLSTQPSVAPPLLVGRVKGRLQHLIRADEPKAFQRNHWLYSLGEKNRDAVEAYVGGQVGQHPLADARTARLVESCQIRRPEVDLSVPRESAHGRFVYNLHIVIVNDQRWRDASEERLRTFHDTIVEIARKRGHLLSRAAIVADHVHLTLGCPLKDSPADVALCYMNNLAYAFGMRPMFTNGYYVGTFGKYDRGAVRRNIRAGGEATRAC